MSFRAQYLFWSFGSAVIGFTGWRGLLLVYIGITLGMNLPMVLAFVPRLNRQRQDGTHAAVAERARSAASP